MNSYLGTGDAGDLIAGLPVVRKLGGGDFIISPHVGPGHPREVMTRERANFILPVIAAQPYITSARFEEVAPPVTHNLSTFRAKTHYRRGESLVHWHARHVQLKHSDVDLSPWIVSEQSIESHGKIIFSRSPRYHNPAFKWKQIWDKYGRRALFIGTPEEHELFQRQMGEVPHYRVKDSAEMAAIISGSELFVGNQSFPCWLAMALGHPLIQESCPQCPNSRVPRENSRYVLNNFHL